MTIKFDPTASLIVIPTRLYGEKGKTIARMALDTGGRQGDRPERKARRQRKGTH